MKNKLNITRRDLLNGFALSMAAGSSLSPLEILALAGKETAPYPPSLTGLRGNHPGSFEVAHALARNGASWPRPENQTDDDYDLVVIGGGISGLAAALLYRQRTGPETKILILDNHDDFGGHAKRNEFDVEGERLICYGGSQSLEDPGNYSRVASTLLKDVAIEPDRFYDYYNQSYFHDKKMVGGIYFSEEAYGSDSVHPNAILEMAIFSPDKLTEIIDRYPITKAAKTSLLQLLTSKTDYLAGMTRAKKIQLMKRTSFTDFLREHAGITEEVVVIMRDIVKGYWGMGFDALSAMEGYRLEMPGTYNLGIGDLEDDSSGEDEPYIFHFPDGNAGVARSIVRKLIPVAVPGSSMEDLVLARVNYKLLDLPSGNTRIRLNSTAIDVRHTNNERYVDVTYISNGKPQRVRGKHTICACYNNILPHICSEMPAKQIEAISKLTKTPLVYISVALRNWKAFENLGFHSIHIPQSTLMHSFGMDFPVSMGGYNYTRNSSQATVIHGTYVPTVPDQGLSAREQCVRGRQHLYELSYDDFERDIVGQMDGALKGGGFDAERDIAAITVNRWPHGYADEYNELYDPPDWNRTSGPHLRGAARMGRISIANSDASAYAYVDGAIDAAARAVEEQLTNL